MEIRKRTIYEYVTADGIVFTDVEEAYKHESELVRVLMSDVEPASENTKQELSKVMKECQDLNKALGMTLKQRIKDGTIISAFESLAEKSNG